MYINGDGETSRDFCYVENAIQANLLAATTENPEALNQLYNVAVAERTTLERAVRARALAAGGAISVGARITVRSIAKFREGDVRHSQADISKAQRLLGYPPTHRIGDGLKEAMAWYVKNLPPAAGTVKP